MRTAIIIDDDPDMVDIISEFLEMYGLKILGKGHNGKDAVSLYQEHGPDMVLLDMMMPEYDGFYAIDEIKKFDDDALIIAVTADFRPETIEKLKQQQIKILHKPFDIEKFKTMCGRIEI